MVQHVAEKCPWRHLVRTGRKSVLWDAQGVAHLRPCSDGAAGGRGCRKQLAEVLFCAGTWEQTISGPGSHTPSLLRGAPAPGPNRAECPAVGRGKPVTAPGSVLAEQAKWVSLEARNHESNHWPSRLCELAAVPDP